MALTDVAPSRRFSRPVLISSNMKKSTALPRPLRERLVHLLALKPYRKPELLVRLTKDGLSAQDKDTLDSLLQQVRVALQTWKKILFFFSPPQGKEHIVIWMESVCVCSEFTEASWEAHM